MSKKCKRPASLAAPHGSTFDAYAQAALSGLLANRAVQTAVRMHSYLNNKEDQVPRIIVEAAMEYATIAVKRRNELLSNVRMSDVKRETLK